MELIDEIMNAIAPFVDEMEPIKNALFITLSEYSIERKSTEIVKYEGEQNELLLKKFLVAKKIKGCTERTLAFYGTEINKALNDFNKPVIDITPDDVSLRIALRLNRDKVSRTTADNEVRCLRSFFEWLHTQEYIPRNPMMKIEKIKPEKKKKKAFTEVEIELMRNEITNNRVKAIFELLLSTGCRVSELVGMKISDVEQDKVLVHGKGEKDRYVYLNAKALVALNVYLKERHDNNPYIFPECKAMSLITGENKTPTKVKEWHMYPEWIENGHIDTGSIEATIRKLGNKVNVKAHPHKFRRTCATLALSNGMPIEKVSMMLGHEQINTTQIYLDMSETDLEQAHKKYVR